MASDNELKLPDPGGGPHYDWAATAAAEIVNLHIDSGKPKHVLFGRILFTILNAMRHAEEDLGRARFEPSEN